MHYFESVSFAWIQKGNNKDADALAKQALVLCSSDNYPLRSACYKKKDAKTKIRNKQYFDTITHDM